MILATEQVGLPWGEFGLIGLVIGALFWALHYVYATTNRRVDEANELHAKDREEWRASHREERDEWKETVVEAMKNHDTVVSSLTDAIHAMVENNKGRGK